MENRPMTSFSSPTALRLFGMATLAERLADGARLTARECAEAAGIMQPGAPWDDMTATDLCDILDAISDAQAAQTGGLVTIVDNIILGDIPADAVEEHAMNGGYWSGSAAAMLRAEG
jgi:hypothetical protein